MKSKYVELISKFAIKVNWRGDYVWVAMEIAEYLDYDKPSKVVNYFLTASGLVGGKDYLAISQNDLREFKDILVSLGIGKFRQSPKLVLFYVSGLVEFLRYRNKLSTEEIKEILGADSTYEFGEQRGLVKSFNGYEVYTLIWHGKPCWIAIDIAEILGYKEKSKAVLQCIEAEGYKRGKDYDVLDSKEVKELIRNTDARHIPSGEHYSRITVFYKSGLFGFINYAHMPIGKELRKWLRDEVFEELIDMEIGDTISESKFSVKRDNLYEKNMDNLKVSNSKFEIMEVLNVVDKILDEKDEIKLFCLNTIFKNI